MVRNWTLTVFLSLSIFAMKAQDIHFTQYYFSPLNTNPAYTGRFDGDYRIVGNHRSQWAAIVSEQFITSGISYDQNINVFNQDIAVGIHFIHDQASLGYFNQNKLEIAASYKKVFKGHKIAGGVQFGMLHKGLNPNKFTYPNQFNMTEGYFDQSTSNNQNFTISNFYRLDFNAGFSWSKQVTDKAEPVVGFSLLHINTPKESFLNNETNSFPLRKLFDIKVNYKLSDINTIIPTLIFMHQNKAQEIVWGGMVRHKVPVNKYELFDVFAGFSSRNGFKRNYDAFTLLVGGTVREFQLGISYDINASELSSVSHYRGAFELSLIYIAKSTKSKIYNVPCDRL
ncbi:MAG: type IX secretion system PorP/SprF family membrane protein [Glaciecola sp.]|jgi:type IX secretion system PorP/SprF family membrane protein